MKNLLYYIAVVLVIFWAIGFLVYSLGVFIHVLLGLAVIALLVKTIRARKPGINSKAKQYDKTFNQKGTSMR